MFFTILFSIVCFEVQVVSITVCGDNTVSRDLSDNSDIQRSGIISVAVSVEISTSPVHET